MLTNRRSSEGSGACPVISLRQEKAGCFPSCNEIESVGDRGHRRPHILERRLFEPHPLERLRDSAEDAAQRRIGGERAEEGLRLDQFAHVAPHFVDALEEDAVAGEEFAAVGPADRPDHVRPSGKRLGQSGGRLVGCFRRRRVDDRDDPVGPLREVFIELHLLLAPGERARQKLAAVGVDGDMA